MIKSFIFYKPLLVKKHYSFKTLNDLLIFICFSLFSLIDCLTGVCVQMGLPSIGVPFKLFLMFLLFLGLKSYKKYFFVIYLLVLFSFCSVIYFFQDYTDFTNSLSMILKIMMYPFIYVYFVDTYSLGEDSKNKITTICLSNFIVICVNQVLGILGFGFSTYSDGGFGIKGFYYDGNAMAVVCFCLFAFYYSIRKNKLYAFLIAVCSFLLGTKTAILAIFLFFFSVSFSRASKKKRRLIVIFFILCISVFIYLIKFTDIFSYHVEKLKRMYKLFDGKILAVLLSGRSIDLQNHSQFYYENLTLKQLLFGYGYRSGVKIIELDFFDTLYSYGLLFCITILLLYFYPFYNNRHNKEILIFNILIFFITFTSGHVWYNTSTALFFVINNIYFKVELNEKSILYI